jgi:hypothetical protein
VVLTHPDKKDSDIFGSIFQAADAEIILHMVRHYQKDGQARNGDRVTMTWGRDKNNAPPDQPSEYIIDEAYLAPVRTAAGGLKASPATAKRADILAKLPTMATSKAAVFKLIESMLAGTTKKSRQGEFGRLRAEWQEQKRVVQNRNTIRRVV